ncbi:ferredoxin [Enterobacter sp. P82]|uniref:ferredoxin n=1 Tax=Enterobacter sp. P82 TaxID=3123033 RepID=UPI00300C8516
MTTPEKKPKKSARQCRSTVGRLYPEDGCTAVGASSKMVNQVMQSECQVLMPDFRGDEQDLLMFTHLNQA